ncbi:tetratricopeptide repeat protein [Tamlana fucoidanivorans]|uniref:Tetratricopeptide repeat protein n=1 Tax=Allotamlana fucoidanivorans TaxID=2583814 RepID=A0A5C4SJQ6_9FLAO|nr:tetratricopeptide repeat protein [Tamlana fucoidanivorans]TNJ44137.1 tetratricopeptide repeat protein [Tamlana fucoidanivorans]
MRFVFFIGVLLFSIAGVTQEDILAKEYFKNGDYEKALLEYKALYAKSPSNINYINQIISTHQQLEQYDEVEAFLLKLMERINYPAFFVEIGYNFQLKNDLNTAKAYYEKALASIDDHVNNVYGVARTFQNHSLLEEASLAYEKAMTINPEFNFNLQLAQIYGEQGNIEKMFIGYINFIESNPEQLGNIKRALSDFITDDAYSENNTLFRKILLKKLQQAPNTLWNEMLSWLFVQQKDFKKAFTQEKAIFNREQVGLNRIVDLAISAGNDNQTDLAKTIYTYVIEIAPDIDTQLQAHYEAIQLEIKESSKDQYNTIKAKYLDLFNSYGEQSKALKLKISYAHFLAFYMNNTKDAISYLEKTLKLPLNKMEQAQVKLELGDILVLNEQFSKALIYYTQIQRHLKNSTISQEARFRVAKTSYYKGDFKWAESQLKILKASTSQLIANDALDLKLLITDNKYEDSLQTALKLYAKADLLAFQNKKEASIQLLDKILEDHKTEPIIAQALYKQAQLYEEKFVFEKALANYERIITNYRDGILADDAYFHLATIYDKYLNEPEKAKAMYEKIIFNHADSIYFVEARKRFRTLRGDALN